MDGFKVSRMSFSFTLPQWALRAAQTTRERTRYFASAGFSLVGLYLVCPCGADIAPGGDRFPIGSDVRTGRDAYRSWSESRNEGEYLQGD